LYLKGIVHSKMKIVIHSPSCWSKITFQSMFNRKS